jgi:hypothetical protein
MLSQKNRKRERENKEAKKDVPMQGVEGCTFTVSVFMETLSRLVVTEAETTSNFVNPLCLTGEQSINKVKVTHPRSLGPGLGSQNSGVLPFH